LFKIKSFDKIVSLSSVLTYKGTNKRLPEIADELKVNYILEGTYKNAGDQIRISAQLIEAKNDKHIWTNDYDQSVEEIFVIQADIALQIACNLQTFLTSAETQNIQEIPTKNQEAYQLAQKSTLAFEQGEWTKAEDYALRAIELDPNFADVYAGVGFLKLWFGYDGQREIQAAVWEARPYLEKALELNPNLGLGHFGMALLNDWAQWDFVKAEKEFLKAIELEPNNSDYIRAYVEFLLKMNRLEDALIHINQLYEKVITAPDYRLWSYILHKMGKKTEAQEKINEGLELNGNEFFKYAGSAYIWQEEYESALIYLDSALKINEKEILYPWFQASLALAYYKTDNFQKAQEIINQTIDKGKITSAGSPARFTAWYYGAIGEVDSAFYYLGIAYENRSVQMPWLKVSPAFDNLRDDDRYWDLYERTGHKAYDEYMEAREE
jgi:tetratricopeptide (TPR) repeat protein